MADWKDAAYEEAKRRHIQPYLDDPSFPPPDVTDVECHVGHDGECGVDNPKCETAPNWVAAAIRGGDRPTWPWERGKYAAGICRDSALVEVPDYGWNTRQRFEVVSRQDCEDLIALLERVKERLPDGK